MHTPDSLSNELPLDELTRLELLVARRADELSRAPDAPQAGRDWWLEAEREIWRAQIESAPPLAC